MPDVQLRLHDYIRSYDFGSKSQPGCYLEGVIIDFEGKLIYFAVTKRVWEGKEEPVQHPDVGCAPDNGASMFDAAFGPRIVFIHHAPPCFSIDPKVLEALERFKQARRVPREGLL